MKQYWKAYLKVPVVLFLVASLFLHGCAAASVPSNMPSFETAVYYIGEGTVLHGLQSALKGGVGTAIYSNGDKYIFTWVIQNVGMGFFGIDMKNKTVFDVFNTIWRGGQITSVKNVQTVIEDLKSCGWVKVSVTSLPLALQSLVKGFPAIVESVGGKLTIPLYMVIPSPVPSDVDLDKWDRLRNVG